MKVNYDKKETGVYLYKLVVGTAFFSKRSGMDEIGLYIKIDKRSGVFPERYRENVMAVNLATGQVRAFPGDAKVKQVNAEVNILE